MAIGSCCFIFRHNNQLIVGVSNGRGDGEDAGPGRSIWGGLFAMGLAVTLWFLQLVGLASKPWFSQGVSLAFEGLG